MWKTNFTEDHPLQDLLFAMMRSRGIHILDNFPCFFTTAHTEADFVAIATAFKESVRELQEVGLPAAPCRRAARGVRCASLRCRVRDSDVTPTASRPGSSRTPTARANSSR